MFICTKFEHVINTCAKKRKNRTHRIEI